VVELSQKETRLSRCFHVAPQQCQQLWYKKSNSGSETRFKESLHQSFHARISFDGLQLQFQETWCWLGYYGGYWPTLYYYTDSCNPWICPHEKHHKISYFLVMYLNFQSPRIPILSGISTKSPFWIPRLSQIHPFTEVAQVQVVLPGAKKQGFVWKLRGNTHTHKFNGLKLLSTLFFSFCFYKMAKHCQIVWKQPAFPEKKCWFGGVGKANYTDVHISTSYDIIKYSSRKRCSKNSWATFWRNKSWPPNWHLHFLGLKVTPGEKILQDLIENRWDLGSSGSGLVFKSIQNMWPGDMIG
jgi:hypothetical protein